MSEAIGLALIGAAATLAGISLHGWIDSKKLLAAALVESRKAAEAARAAAEAAAMATINARILADQVAKPKA